MPDKKTVAWRGLKGDCPRCGEARLFRAYLKQVETCPVCDHAWGDVRADDGPAWATMLVVGHVLALAFHIIIFRLELSTVQATLALIAIVIVASLIVLPRMKGLFIGWIWRTGALTS